MAATPEPDQQDSKPERQSPYRNRINRSGTLAFDHVYKGVGRIRRASGTKNVARFYRYKAMLDELYEDDQLQILRDVKNGKISVKELYERKRNGTLWTREPKALRPIHPTVEQFIESYPRWEETTRKSYRHQYNNFRSFFEVDSPDATISDIPELLEHYYLRCKTDDTPRKFNYIKDILSKYLNKTFGGDSQIYKAVRQVEGFSTKRRRKPRPLRVTKLMELIKELPPVYGAIVKSMAFSGMNVKELYEDGFEIDSKYSIHIMGKKREARDRRIPRTLYDPKIPKRRIDGLREQLKKVGDGKTQPHDFRRSFTLLLQSAGIIKSRVDAYMGWSNKSMQDDYTEHEIEEFLEEDRQQILLYIDQQLHPEIYVEVWKRT